MSSDDLEYRHESRRPQLWYFYCVLQVPHFHYIMKKYFLQKLYFLCSTEEIVMRVKNNMNDAYSALLCIVVHPKRFTIMWGVSPQPPPVCSIQLDDTRQRRQCAHHTPATGGEERESHRANQVYALTTHQLQVERRERHRANQVYALTTHQLQVERRERVIEPIKCMLSPHTSYRWRGERDIEPIKCMRSPHTSYRWRGEREIEPIKCMLSPHTSYRWRGEREIETIKSMRSPHTSYRWRGERDIEPIKWITLN